VRGEINRQETMLSLLTPEQRVPPDHPLRKIKALADSQLRRLSSVFEEMYSHTGRPSIPPEVVLKSLLLIALYSVRSERQFCEQLDYNLLYRWFLDMNLVEASFDATVFSKNRERLLEHEVGYLFFDGIVKVAQGEGLLSDDHFTVDSTLIEAWASLKSFRRKDLADGDRSDDDPGNATVNFHGEKRSNQTHQSTTDPESRLYRKGSGKEAKLYYGAHALMENRHGLLIDIRVTPADTSSQWRAAEEMIKRQARKRRRLKTLGGDKGYDHRGFIRMLKKRGIAEHIACNDKRPGGSAVDQRLIKQGGYALSQRVRKRIEEIFGWMKTIGGFRKTRYKGRERTQLAAEIVGAAYNLLRIAKLKPDWGLVSR
jgi:transposase